LAHENTYLPTKVIFRVKETSCGSQADLRCTEWFLW